MSARTGSLAALGLLLTATASADAPVNQYETFVSTSTVIADRNTRLEWDRTLSSPLSFEAARLGCENAGKRLPTVKELLSLVDEQRHREFISKRAVDYALDGRAFGGDYAREGQVWTATQSADTSTGRRFAVSLQTGEALPLDAVTDKGVYVRCVRYKP
jgi:hypothetical protein